MQKEAENKLSEDDARALVLQIQGAHRLLAGFYERFLGLINEMAIKIDQGLEFWYWIPEETWVPPRTSTAPLSRSAWDFLPLYAFSCVYRRVDGEFMKKGDVAVAFLIYAEDSFDKDNRTAKGHPDPLEMQAGKAVLRTYVYRCRKTAKKEFSPVFDAAPWIETNGTWQNTGDYLSAIGHEWALAEVIADPSGVIATMTRHYAEEGAKA